MNMLKLLFQKLQIRPIHPGSWEKQPASWGTAKDYRLGTSGGIRAFVFQGQTDTTSPWEQLTAQDRNVAVSST